jgi:hypothetical protein
VLNAFRHQRFPHQEARRDEEDAPPVLNAFRHQRFPHPGRPRRTDSEASGAQRLSASEVPAQYHQRAPPTQDVCSTPFGIRGSRTRYPERRYYVVVSCSTPFGIRGSRTLRRQSLRATLVEMCSTPFGIRGSRTWLRGPHGRQPGYVLNAFRHQRFPHRALGNPCHYCPQEGYLQAPPRAYYRRHMSPRCCCCPA